MLSFDCEGKWGLTDCLTEQHRQLYTTANLEDVYWRLTSLLRKYGIDATFAFTAAFSLTRERFDGLRPDLEELRTRAEPWIGRALAAIERDKGQGWFSPACFDMVRESERHEIASHGFSHLPWRAPYVTRAALDAELAMCRRVPAFSDESVRTFVFPRNQVAHQDLLAEHRFAAYREKRSVSSRAANFVNEFNLFPPSDDFSWDDKVPLALPAGHFLNWRHGLRRSVPAAVTVCRWKNMLRDAGKGGGIVHAWTHPENFIDGHEMFPMLEEILRFAADEREAGRLQVMTNTQFVARTEAQSPASTLRASPARGQADASAAAAAAPVKMPASSTRWEVSEVAVSQVIFAAMQVYIPWLAAAKAPLAELAMLALAQSIVWPLAMIAQLQLRTLYLVQGERSLLPLFVQMRLAGCVFLVASAALITGMLHSGPLLLSLALALAVTKCVENVADIMHGELQRSLEVSRAARSQTWRCAIFIGVYTAGLLSSGQLLPSLVAACMAMAAWVVVVDMRPRKFWRDLLSRGSRLEHAGATLKAGLALSTALALSSLSVMVGRWAAVRANDTEVLAASALAGTMASVVAVLLVVTQQFCLTQARAQLNLGGVAAFRAWSKVVTGRLHLAFAGLTLAWVAAALFVYDFGLPLPGHHLAVGMQHTVVVLAGCFLVGGWLNLLCFSDTLLQYLMQRNGAILLIALLQVIAAAAASLLLYPFVGWIAIGIAELVRALSLIAAVKYASRHDGR